MRIVRLAPLFAAIACALTLPATAQPNLKAPPVPAGMASAVFAGGCYWTVEDKFENIKGVVDAMSGYTNGTIPYPEYEEVLEGLTGHYEAVRVIYDPKVISYRQLADHFWRMIDPTDATGQVCDHGPQYQTAIFFANPAERQTAFASMLAINDGPRRGNIKTKILPAKPFYPAHEEYQDYAKTYPLEYEKYRVGCGRDRRLAVIWADKAKLG